MGTTLRREVRCRMCGTVQCADNEYCGNCGDNLFKQLTCKDCKNDCDTNPNKCENVKGRCFNFNQVDFDSDFNRK